MPSNILAKMTFFAPRRVLLPQVSGFPPGHSWPVGRCSKDQHHRNFWRGRGSCTVAALGPWWLGDGQTLQASAPDPLFTISYNFT